MKTIEVLSKSQITNYYELETTLRFDIPDALKKASSAATLALAKTFFPEIRLENIDSVDVLALNKTIGCTNEMSNDQVKTILIAHHEKYNSVIQSIKLNESDLIIGASYDGSSWT